MTEEKVHILADKKTAIAEEVSLLRDYRNWCNFSDDQNRLLEKALRSPSENLWFDVCHKVVQEKDEIWIKDFAEKDINSLPSPFESFPIKSESDNKRKYAAMCMANCAVAAIQVGNSNCSNGKGEQETKFIDCIKRAVVFRQRANQLDSTFEVENFSISDFPQALADSKQFLNITFRDLSSKYADYEILPIRDLIYFFLNDGQESEEKQEFLSEAKFPVVDSDSKRAKICQLEIERFSNGKGRLYKDPIRMSFSIADLTFQEGIRDAFDYIRTQYGEECNNCDFRWRVCESLPEKPEDSGNLPILEGSLAKKSVGLAATIAFSQSINQENFGDNYVYTGKVNKGSGKVEKVGSYIHKLEALPTAFTFFMPSEDFPNLERLRKYYDIRPAVSFMDVTRKIQFEKEEIEKKRIRREREEQEKRRKTKKKIIVIATIAIVAISITVILAVFENQRRKFAEEKEKITRANHLAAEGNKKLAEGDRNSAQAFFAKALALDDRSEYRSGLLSASFDEPIKTTLSWFKEISNGSFPLASLDSKGERLAVSYSQSYNIQILSALDGTELSNFNFEEPITAISLSSNGKYLAVRTLNSKLVILELDTKKTVFEIFVLSTFSTMFFQHYAQTDLISFSSDDNYLATNFGKVGVMVINVESRRIIKTFSHSDLPNFRIFSLAFSPDNILAYGFLPNNKNYNPLWSGSSPIFIRSIEDNSVNKKINLGGLALNLGFTKTGNLIKSPISSASLGIATFTNVLDNLTEQKQPESYSLEQKLQADYLFAVIPNSDYFISTGDDGHIRLWEEKKQLEQISFIPMGKPAKIMSGENGKILFLNSNGKIFCWKTNINDHYERKRESSKVFLAGTPRFTIFPDRFSDKTDIFDISTQESILSFRKSKTNEYTLRVSSSPDASKFALFREGKILEVYDANTRNILFQYTFVESLSFCCLKFSNDGTKLAITESFRNEEFFDEQEQNIQQSYSAYIFSLSNFEIQSKISLPTNLSRNFYIGKSNFSPQGNFLIVPSDDSIYFFDSLTGQLKHTIPYSNTDEECILSTDCSWFAVSPDEKHVGITYALDGMVQLWNLENYRRLVDVIKMGSSPESSIGVGFTKNSQLLVWSSGTSGRLHFYDVNSNRTLDLQTQETISQITNTFERGLIINGRYTLNEDGLNIIIFGSPSSINSEIFSKNRFRIDTQEVQSSLQKFINTVFSKRQNSESVAGDWDSDGEVDDWDDDGKIEVAVTDNGFEEKGESGFGSAESEYSKPNNNKTGSCTAKFLNPVFNPYPTTFGGGSISNCSHFPIIEVKEVGGEDPQSQQEWEAVRKIKTGKKYYGLLHISNGAVISSVGQDVPSIGDMWNVRIRATINTIRDGNHTFETIFLSDNAPPLSAVLNLQTENSKVISVDDTIEIFDPFGNLLKKMEMSNFIQKESNKTIIEIPIGDLKPGFETDLFIRFEFATK